MNDRIKELRKSEQLTQSEFGKRIGLKQSSVADLESGRNTPSEQTILAICREFCVSEEWIRTGEGPMKRTLTRKQEIAEFIGRVSNLPDDDFKTRLISTLAKLNADQWEALEQIVVSLNGK